jgi:hypothetical protein
LERMFEVSTVAGIIRECPAQKTLYLGHYLSMVKTANHREVLTSTMLSTHSLCIAEVESPEHALLECQASPAVLNLRTVPVYDIYNLVVF